MIENDSLTDLHAGKISFMQYLAEEVSDDRKTGARRAQNVAVGLLTAIAAQLLGFESYWIHVIGCLAGACAASAFLPHPYVIFRVRDEHKAKRVQDILGISCLVLYGIAFTHL